MKGHQIQLRIKTQSPGPEFVIINKIPKTIWYVPKSNMHRTVRPVPQNDGTNTHIVTPVIISKCILQSPITSLLVTCYY